MSSTEGLRLRELRERSGLTQREAAALAGVGRRDLQRVERGKKQPTPGLAGWLARVYEREALNGRKRR